VRPVVKNPPANARDERDAGLKIPRLGRSPNAGNDSLFQYSCLENPRELVRLFTQAQVWDQSNLLLSILDSSRKN